MNDSLLKYVLHRKQSTGSSTIQNNSVFSEDLDCVGISLPMICDI